MTGVGQNDWSDLPAWFWRLSPLTMDALRGPDAQYRAGARDMLIVVRQTLDDYLTPPEPLVGADDEHTPRGRTGDSL